ncbi:MAG: exodeoxyribonuclease VII large subunit [Defluviitaleaceae bacterium]|nr:exodeoxyribonuclease VII large subunit [Defluviitaleaceae bacterium]
MLSVLSVTALNKYIKSLMEEDVLLEAITLRGEISNFTSHSSGHLYFSLKDADSSISCVMFRDAAASLKFKPGNGMEVLIFGRVGVYEKQGRYQVYANVMEDYGRGKLHAMFEALKAKLEEKGYFDPKIKKPLPKEPKVVALVTSPTGAALRDMLKIAGNLDPAVKIVIVPCLVQGDGAAQSISEAISLVNRWGLADVMVVGRGGGSIEDLWAFNEEIVAEAVFNSMTPVISAVGHEIDFTIVDFAADYRASTPSAAIADLIKPGELKVRKLRGLSGELIRLMADILDSHEYRLRDVAGSRAFVRHKYLFDNYMIRLDNLYNILNMQIDMHNERAEAAAANLFKRLEEASPIKAMDKGYSITTYKGGVVKSVKDVITGQKINVRLKDGSFDAEVL